MYNHLFLLDKKINNILFLGKEETQHLHKVLKIKKNDIVNITDGFGNLWEAIVLDISKYVVKLLSIKHYKYNKKKYQIHLFISMIKSFNRLKWLIEKSVEMGIDEITPLYCNNTEKFKININRIIKIIYAAAKQSFNTYIPILHQPKSYQEFIISQKNNNTDLKLIAHCNTNFNRNKIKDIIYKYKNKKIYKILIGPEGDFSFYEIEQALNTGWYSVQLSNNILRAETAAIIFITAISIFNE